MIGNNFKALIIELKIIESFYFDLSSPASFKTSSIYFLLGENKGYFGKNIKFRKMNIFPTVCIV
jgi:hypothetical protein